MDFPHFGKRCGLIDSEDDDQCTFSYVYVHSNEVLRFTWTKDDQLRRDYKDYIKHFDNVAGYLI